MRVVTWNVWWRFGDWRKRQPAIVATLEQLAPDICTLQEVWFEDGGADLGRDVAERLGLGSVAVSPSPRPERWQSRAGEPASVGVANVVLTRYPILATTTLALPPGDAPDEGRTALLCRLDTPAGTVDVVTAHVNSSPAHSAIRIAQVRALVTALATWRPGPADLPPIVTGDFNTDPDADEMRLLGGWLTAPVVAGSVLVDAWRYADPHQRGETWDRANPCVAATGEPSARVDYVFVGAPGAGVRLRVTSVRRAGDEPVDGIWASDHAAVVVDLEAELANPAPPPTT